MWTGIAAASGAQAADTAAVAGLVPVADTAVAVAGQRGVNLPQAGKNRPAAGLVPASATLPLVAAQAGQGAGKRRPAALNSSSYLNAASSLYLPYCATQTDADTSPESPRTPSSESVL